MIGTPSLCSADRKDSCNFSTDWQEVLLFSCYLCVHSQGLRKLQLRQNQQSHLQRKNPQKSQHLPEFQASFCRCSMFLIDWCKENVEGLRCFGLTTTSPMVLAQGSLHIFPRPSLRTWEWNSYQPWPLLTIFCSHWKERVTESGRSGMGFSFTW